MKWLIASDIHGSAHYFEKLMRAVKKAAPDKIILLGDILYHGPRNDLPYEYAPKKIIPELNKISDKITCVRGNCDAEVDNMVLDFDVTPDFAELGYKNHTIFATHGHIYSPENPPKLKKGDVLLCGHTHIPACTDYGDFTYINPGSVSIPKENSHHGYIIFEDGEFIWYDLDSNKIKSFTLD